MKPPPKLYKYERICTQSLSNLKAQSVYFSSPVAFNDPYDYDINAGIKTPNNTEVIEIKNYLCESRDTPASVKRRLLNSTIEEVRRILLRIADEQARQISIDWKKRGVACLSECNDDLLMWAHYGGGYKGFCLEFSTEFEPFSRAVKVKYSQQKPKINIKSLIVNNDRTKIFELFSTKSDSWHYEREWRCLHRDAGTLFGFRPEALTAVYFGPDIDRRFLEIVCLILAGQNPKVTLWEGHRDNELFKVRFVKFTYTNYIEANKARLE